MAVAWNIAAASTTTAYGGQRGDCTTDSTTVIIDNALFWTLPSYTSDDPIIPEEPEKSEDDRNLPPAFPVPLSETDSITDPRAASLTARCHSAYRRVRRLRSPPTTTGGLSRFIAARPTHPSPGR